MANNNSLNNTSYGFTLPSLNLNFTSTAQRITGDMSNGTHANRLAFQSSTVNGNTSLFVLPNGSGVSSSVLCSNAGDPTNSAFAQIQIDNTSVKLISSVLGGGVQLPMEIRIGGTAAIDINTSRAVSIANTSAGVPLTITGTSSGGLTVNQSNSGAANISLIQSSATAEPPYVNFFKSRSGGNVNAADQLGNIRFFGFATANQVAAQITCTAESIGATRVSGSISVWTTNTAGSTSPRLNISADGAVTIPATVAGNVPLTITGTNAGGLVVNQATGGVASIYCVQSSADVQPVYINSYKNRAGGNINAGDILYQSQVFGFATAYQVAAQSRCYAESIGAARVSGAFDWFTTSTAGVSGQRLYISSDGALVINTPAAALTALTVNGFNTAGTYAQQINAVTPGAQFSAFRALNNTATAGSSCLIECSVTGQAATGGDPFLRFVNYGTNGVSLGLDTSANQFSMSKTFLGDGNTFLTFDNATNQINLPLQCSFMAEVSVAIPNVTGNGAAYNVIFNSERFDVSNSYNNATGIFTAPKTGKYLFSGSLRISGLTALMTYAQVVLVNSGGNLLFGINNIGLIRSVTTAADNCCIPFSAVVSMTAGDATFIQVIIFNGAGNTAGIAISTSFWSGQLLS
ncbi:C1q domain containing protein [uncultured Caudovirales phage]|uniref:C1q domain containing protein n=1 Tax=uncultured Caudovirales phage TaxID=2100421 RepID=A0A6J5S5I1_9CAUD|nr:C1q domain containing protein [uncultured Caudovirales phage]CAB4203768.1 C1q domain containing protein [uncultured Caudovirales phage]CAB4215596.1 C1q domain containing protein [uncultured Caudovirales phage]